MSPNKPPGQQCGCAGSHWMVALWAAFRLRTPGTSGSPSLRTSDEAGISRNLCRVIPSPGKRFLIITSRPELRDMGPRWQSPCTFRGTDKYNLSLFWSPQEVGTRLLGSGILMSAPRVGSGSCESRWGHSRSVLSGTKGGQVHALLRLEESGWFFRTVLPCNPPTALSWEDYCPWHWPSPGVGGAFRFLVDWHSAEKLPHGGTQPKRCCPLPAGPRGGYLSSDPQATWGFTASIPALVCRQCRGGHPSLWRPSGCSPCGLMPPAWCSQHQLMVTSPSPGVHSASKAPRAERQAASQDPVPVALPPSCIGHCSSMSHRPRV